MTTKKDALDHIVSLAQEHHIKIEEISAAITQEQPEEKPSAAAYLAGGLAGGALSRRRIPINTVLGYLGGILIFAGLGILITDFWDQMNFAMHVLITLGTGFVAFILGVASCKDPRFQKAATPLFLIAALLEPAGIFVILDHFSTQTNAHLGMIFMSSVMLLQTGLSFGGLRRTSLLFLTLLFGWTLFATTLDYLNMAEELIVFVSGLTLMCLSYAIDKTPHSSITPFWYFIGSLLLLWGGFEVLENRPFEVLFIGLSCSIVYLATFVRSRSLLLVGTLATLCYIGRFSAEHFADSVGWPLTLIMMGLLLIGMGAFALKLDKKYIRP